ncbi:hypothetical protein [Nocardioides dilutus]
MNNAGLPGTGLGGLFYIVLAFWMPLAELPRTLRGRSSVARWRRIGAQVALAGGIVASVAVTAAGYLAVAGSASPFGVRGPALVLAPVVLAAVLLSVLVVVLRTWAGWERYRA